MAATTARTTPSPACEWRDPVIEAYKKDVDRTLIRQMLERTPEQRLVALEQAVEDVIALREAAGAALRAER